MKPNIIRFGGIAAWILVFFLPCALNAQLIVNGGKTATELADILTGSGLTISNATIINPGGVSAGAFSNGNTTVIGLDDGVLLTSGDIILAPGPNNSPSATKNNGATGYGPLNALIPGYSTNDACVLEFDLIPTGNKVTFRYVFASEEYEEYFCTSFNDVFAFFVDGPNPGGGNYVDYNIALIPGTSTPVSINNLGPGSCNGVNNSGYYNNNNGGATIQYDGYTDVLTAEVDLVRCQTYHFTLAIADAGDHILDSGVFIEAGSFNSNDILATFDLTHPSCPGWSDGEIDLIPGGGVAPYSYLWSTTAITEDITGLTEGNYWVIVTDADGCTETYNLTLTDTPDTTPPEMHCKSSYSIDLSDAGTASILPQYLDAGSTDYCGIDTYAASQTDFTCADVGMVNVMLTITDVNSNTNTCVVPVTVNNSPNFTVDVGPYCVPVYYGYLPMSCTDINTYVTGGTPPYSYSWSNSETETTASITVCPTTTTVYTVTVTDANGCSITTSKQVEVVDVHCGHNNDKVWVCHVPPGNPGNEHNICISHNAVPAHLAHGDYLGNCGYVPCSPAPTNPGKAQNEILVTVTPNPTNGTLLVSIGKSGDNEQMSISIYDANGKEAMEMPWRPVAPTVEIDLATQVPTGIYTLQVKFSSGETSTIRFTKL